MPNGCGKVPFRFLKVWMICVLFCNSLEKDTPLYMNKLEFPLYKGYLVDIMAKCVLEICLWIFFVILKLAQEIWRRNEKCWKVYITAEKEKNLWQKKTTVDNLFKKTITNLNFQVRGPRNSLIIISPWRGVQLFIWTHLKFMSTSVGDFKSSLVYISF